MFQTYPFSDVLGINMQYKSEVLNEELLTRQESTTPKIHHTTLLE